MNIITLLGKTIRYSTSLLSRAFQKDALPYWRHFFRQEAFLLGKWRIKSAYNYFWTIAFTKEEGLGLLDSLYRYNPNFAPYPERIELEVTNKCCLRCLKCEHTYWNEKPMDMSFEEFKMVIEQFPKLKAISLTGIGHGFENKDYLKMLEYLKSKSIFVQFFDPFFLINESIAEKLIDIGVDKTTMSIDGATKETYEKLQVGSNFERVIGNAKSLTRLKKEMNSLFPELHFLFVVTKENAHEMPKFVELAHSIIDGTQSLVIIYFICLIPFEENRFLMPEQKILEGMIPVTVEKAEKFTDIKLKPYFIHFVRNENKPPISNCTAWTVPFITVDGTAYPCCTLTEGNIRHLVKEVAFGNLFDKHFKEIWYSEEFINLRQMIHKGEVPLVCYKLKDCTLYDTTINKKLGSVKNKMKPISEV